MTILKNAKKILFDILFVMTDGAARPSKSAFRKVVILYTIDLLQVIRVMISPVYGWSYSTYNIAKHIDLVYNGVALATIFVPRYTFFAIAFLLVAFAIGDAVYCARLFHNNEINTIGPIKVLRFMVTALVTTLFSSMIKWLLTPLECQISGLEDSLSAYIHNEPGRCTPWGVPEIIISVPTVLLASMYMAFAVLASYFSLEPNCLSCHPNARFTGHVEVLFVVTKISTTCLVYAAKGVSPLATSCVIFVLTAALLWRHLAVLPFHRHSTNLFRGGIYGVVLWLGICNVLVSIVYEMKVKEEFWKHTFQWILLACIPVSFPVGMAMVQNKHNKLLLSIDRLRGEWEAQTVAEKRDLQRGNESLNQRRRRMSIELMEAMPSQGVLRTQAKKRSPYDDFFDPSWERKRAFSSGSMALTVSRLLLYQREETDLPLLNYIVSRALEEFPNSETLKLFRLSLLRFVFRNTVEAALEEKKLKNSNAKLSSDNAYVLYAVERKASQENASTTMGRGGHFNAINLMEFQSGMNQARSFHKEAIREMQMFWHIVAKDLRNSAEDVWISGVEDCVTRLISFDAALHKAKQEYGALLEKYPQSVQLLVSYAAFCDVVLNDKVQASERRKQSAAIEGMDEDEINDMVDRQRLEDITAKSHTGTSETADMFRATHTSNLLTWSTHIFGEESRMLRIHTFRLKLLLFFIGVVSISGFCVTQFWLLKEVAGNDQLETNRHGILRTRVVTFGFLLRSQMLAAAGNDTSAFTALATEAAGLVEDFKYEFGSSYADSNEHGVRDFFLDERYNVSLPFPTGWRTEVMNMWQFGNEWGLRMERASTASLNEFRDLDFSPLLLSEGRTAIKFVNEHLIRLALPAFEDTVAEYQGGASKLRATTEMVVLTLCLTEGFIQLMIAALMLYTLITCMRKIQHLYLGTVFGLTVSNATAKGFNNFYRQAMNDLRILDDITDLSHDGNDDNDDNDDNDNDKTETSETAEDYPAGFLASPQRGNLPYRIPPRTLQPLASADYSGNASMDSPNPVNNGRDNPSKHVCHSVSQPLSRSVSELTLGNLSKFARTPDGSFKLDNNLSSFVDSLAGPFGRVSNSAGDAEVRSPQTGDEAAHHGSERVAVQADEVRLSATKGIPSTCLKPYSIHEVDEEVQSTEEDNHTYQSEEVQVQSTEEDNHTYQSEEVQPKEAPVVESELPFEEDSGAGVGFHLSRSEVATPVSDEDIKRKVDRILGMELSTSPVSRINLATPDEGRRTLQSRQPNGGKASPEPERPKKYHRTMDAENASGFEPLRQDVSLADEDIATTGTAQTPVINAGEIPSVDTTLDVCAPADSFKTNLKGSVTFKRQESHDDVTRASSIGMLLKRVASSITSFKEGSKEGKEGKDDNALVTETRTYSCSQETVEILPPNLVSAEQKRAIFQLLRRHTPTILRRYVWVGIVILVMGLCILNATFPARRLGELVNLSPTINQAGRRWTLALACIHLSRELILDDGYTRMEKTDLANALQYFLVELKKVDSAIRLGGDLGISTGADDLYDQHNTVMYQAGCPWRTHSNKKQKSDDHDHQCKTPMRPGVASQGLYHLYISFAQSVETLLLREASEYITNSQEFARSPRDMEELNGFDKVELKADYRDLLTKDPDLPFILDMVQGDLQQGFDLITADLEEAAAGIVDSAASSNRTLFVIYVLVLYGGLYWLVYSKSSYMVHLEAKRARNFVARLPVDTLSKLEYDSIVHLFSTSFYK